MKKFSLPMRSRPAGPSGFSPLRRAGRPFGGFALPSALVLAAAGPAAALTISFPGIGLIVPDGNPSGVADSRQVTSDIVNIESVTVVVSLSGTYNGDLFM